jgi:asparagine synthase (glutamine-hydrolysing)
MCGIAGLWNWPGADRAIVRMSGSIEHRGPDGAAVWMSSAENPRVVFAHRRLSIIDLSEAANQPFVKDGLTMVFNGEIYNYKELRAELESAGVRFRTNSDTEVLLEAFRAWDTACFARLRGMFALAVFNEATQRLVFARDHFGIKPVFIADQGDRIAFASELKAIRTVLDRVEPNDEAIAASLMFNWIPDHLCAIKGVHKLPAGCFAEVTPDKTLRTVSYFSAMDLAASSAQPIDADELYGIVEDSVRAHLIADVEVATFLSGGLDSSLISAIAASRTQDLQAFTIAFRPEDQKIEAMPDDLLYARKVASHFGITLNEVVLQPNIVSMLPEMVHTLDEPIGDPAALNTFLICQGAREMNRKVLLSGMGADEMFGGYRKHAAYLQAERFRRLPSSVQGGINRAAGPLPVVAFGKGLRTVRWGKKFLQFASMPGAESFLRSYSYYGMDDLITLGGPSLASLVQPLRDAHDRVFAQAAHLGPVNQMCMVDTQWFMAGLNLAYSDRASMRASTEVRVPFIDIEVAKAAFRCTDEQKLRRAKASFVSKAILKDAAERILPHEIVHRPKAPFAAPLRAWISRDLRSTISDQLPKGQLVERGLVTQAGVERLMNQEFSGQQDRSKELWQLLTVETWLSNLSS